MRVIIYERPDGGVSIVYPAFNKDDPPGWTEADSEQRAFNALPPTAINPRFANASDIPADRTFRSAWKSDLTVDMPKARAIHKERLRVIMKEMLAQADIDYLQAEDDNDNPRKAQIAAKRRALSKALNDPAIAAANTPDELKAAIPDVLK